MTKVLDEEKIKKILDLVNENKTTNEISKILGIKYGTLSYYFRKNNITFNNKNKIKCSHEEAWKKYQEFQSLKDVADHFGATKEGIRNLLKRNSYELNKLVKHTFNQNFFKEDNERSFYWAGFIAADGCVKKRKTSSKTTPYRYELSISLSIKDKSFLEKFKSDIDFSGNIGHKIIKNSKRNVKWNDSEAVEISITSKENFDDLSRFNIVPRKSLIYTFPEWLINHKYVNHFMRGYFDGDGSFYIIDKKKEVPQVAFSLRGTQDFLKTYRSIFESNNLVKKREKDIRINSGIGVLEYGGNKVVKSIKDFLYKDANVYLERKLSIVSHL